jgi:hypothetical protein
MQAATAVTRDSGRVEQRRAALRDLIAIAHDQHGVFTYSQALEAGLTRRQIDARVALEDFAQLHRGVFIFTAVAKSFRRDLMAAVLAGGARSFASGRSAAQLRDLPGGTQDLIEISCDRWRRVHIDSLVVHERVRVLPGDLVTVDGIRCTRPELTLIDIAALKRPKLAEEFFHAMRRERLATYASIEKVFYQHARRGRPGIAEVRALLEKYDRRSAPTESTKETDLLQVIRAHGFDEPDTQVVVRNAAGRFVGRADFGYRDLQIVVLYHSRQWHATDEDNERDDAQRNQYLGAGWIPVIARWPDLKSGGFEFAAALRAAMKLSSANLRQKSTA